MTNIVERYLSFDGRLARRAVVVVRYPGRCRGARPPLRLRRFPDPFGVCTIWDCRAITRSGLQPHRRSGPPFPTGRPKSCSPGSRLPPSACGSCSGRAIAVLTGSAKSRVDFRSRRGGLTGRGEVPDYAALHPGYACCSISFAVADLLVFAWPIIQYARYRSDACDASQVNCRSSCENQ